MNLFNKFSPLCDTADLPSTKDSSSEEEESEDEDESEEGSNDDQNYYEASEADESSKSFFLKIKSTMRSDVYFFHSKSSSSFSIQSKVISNKVGLRSPFENPETE